MAERKGERLRQLLLSVLCALNERTTTSLLNRMQTRPYRSVQRMASRSVHKGERGGRRRKGDILQKAGMAVVVERRRRRREMPILVLNPGLLLSLSVLALLRVRAANHGAESPDRWGWEGINSSLEQAERISQRPRREEEERE